MCLLRSTRCAYYQTGKGSLSNNKTSNNLQSSLPLILFISKRYWRAVLTKQWQNMGSQDPRWTMGGWWRPQWFPSVGSQANGGHENAATPAHSPDWHCQWAETASSGQIGCFYQSFMINAGGRGLWSRQSVVRTPPATTRRTQRTTRFEQGRWTVSISKGRDSRLQLWPGRWGKKLFSHHQESPTSFADARKLAINAVLAWTKT